MSKKFLLLGLFLFTAVCDANGFNYSDFYDKNNESNREGKFLFDTLFGLELEEEILNQADATNSLKSCDCGESKLLVGVFLWSSAK